MYIIFCTTLLLVTLTYATKDPPIIKLEQGYLKGHSQKTKNGRNFFSYQGIPYAEPPIGNLRFKEPLPGKIWKGTLDATKEHAMCVQFDIFLRNYTVIGDENCLYLNVYTPKITKKDLLPVIFYIHGGGFVKGSANPSLWGPYLMLDKDVVFVTMNYRLGALGFLSTGDEVVPGNNGLKDQSLALKWVKHNIDQFGGNPQKIVVAGQSAGGASAYYHLLSPLSKDIPSAAISVSGIAPSLWNLAQKGEASRNAKRLAESLSCPTDTSENILKCLTEKPAYEIQEQIAKFLVFNYDPSILYKPVIESLSMNAFISEHPIQLIQSGKMSQIPFMTGITTEDGTIKSSSIYYNYSLIERLNSNFKEILPMFLHYDEFEFKTDSITNEIKDFYFKEKEINNNTKAEVTNMVTDALFMVPARLTSTLHAKHSTKPVFFYLFGYKSSTSYSKRFGDPNYDYGVCHCDDLLYLVPNSFINHKQSVEDVKMTDFMTTLWYNFASTGNPTPHLDSLTTTKWEPVITDDLEYYYIKNSSTVEMHKNLYEERFQFWKKLRIITEHNKLKDEL